MKCKKYEIFYPKDHLFIFNHSRISDVLLNSRTPRQPILNHDFKENEKEHYDWVRTISWLSFQRAGEDFLSLETCQEDYFCFQDSEDLHPQMVKQARSSGQLNLSGRGLVSVPDKVSLSLVHPYHVTWTLASHWSRLIYVLTQPYICQGVEPDGVWRGGEQTDDGWGGLLFLLLTNQSPVFW